MSARRRLTVLLLVCILVLLYRLSHIRHWDGGINVQRFLVEGPPELERFVLPDLRESQPTPPPWKDVFPPGEPKPSGSEYSRTIVMASTKRDNTSWVDEQLGHLLEPRGPFKKAIYVADDRFAPLHPLRNKGNEVNIYLTYIVDHYEELPDVAIFVHPDRWTWHNNEMMDEDLAGMIKYLNPDRVVRNGYVNMRCHWIPGCPDWIHPKENAKENLQKSEERAISERWSQLFPLVEMPGVLSQPCCAQFALSKERIRAIPRERYLYLRSWIMRTDLDDFRSGRVFEYIWQYIFTGNGVVCPDMHVCYCDGYGICFESKEQFEHWYELRYQKAELQSRIRKAQGKSVNWDIDKGPAVAVRPLELDEDVGVDGMQAKVLELKSSMDEIRNQAFLRGASEAVRAHVAGREH